jgi:hypothetical protein
VSPAIERTRAKKAEQRRTTADVKRQRAKADRDAYWVYEGCDLEREAKVLWNYMHRNRRRIPSLPTIRVRRGDTYRGSGLARQSQRDISVCFDPATTPLARVLLVLAHELAHIAAGCHHRHDSVWANTYATAIIGRWGREHAPGWARPEKGYAVDRWVRDFIDGALEARDRAAMAATPPDAAATTHLSITV